MSETRLRNVGKKQSAAEIADGSPATSDRDRFCEEALSRRLQTGGRKGKVLREMSGTKLPAEFASSQSSRMSQLKRGEGARFRADALRKAKGPCPKPADAGLSRPVHFLVPAARSDPATQSERPEASEPAAGDSGRNGDLGKAGRAGYSAFGDVTGSRRLGRISC